MPAIPPHSTPTVDRPWDANTQVSRIRDGAPATTMRRMYAWVQAGADPRLKGSYRFPHHEVSAGGQPGPANLAACRNAMARLSTANIPAPDRAGVTAHIQRHMKDGGSDMNRSEEKELPRKELARAFEQGAEMREAEEGSVLFGHFAVFDVWAEIRSMREGHFMERIQRGAFAKAITEQREKIRCLFQHGKDVQIGEKPLGAIEVLIEDEIGAYYEVPLLDTNYVRELIPGLRKRLYGASFRFTVLRDRVNKRPPTSSDNPNGIPERTILEVALHEFGPVTWGAYADATAGIRSLTDVLADVDLVQLASPVILDDERIKRAQAFISRSLPEADAVRPGVWVPTQTANTTIPVSTTTTAPLTTFTVVTNTRGEFGDAADVAEKHRYARIIEYVGRTAWAIHPTYLALFNTILAERSSGHRPTEEEIRERIGTPIERAETAPSPVAVIPILGSIVPRAAMMQDTSKSGTSIETLQKQFRSALNDPEVESILFDIDSPGGSVDLVPEFAAEVRAARGQKPIVALANTFAASAAYWIATAADEIVVSPSGEVGSIGVYSAHQDLSEQQAQKGIKTTLISAGDYKVEGNPYEPLAEDAQVEMQSKVDAYYSMFLDAVAAGRDTTKKTVEADFGQGRMVMASKAVKLGMADRVGTYEQTVARLTKSGGRTTTKAAAILDAVTPGDVAPPESAEGLPETSHPSTGRRSDNRKLYGGREPKWRISGQ